MPGILLRYAQVAPGLFIPSITRRDPSQLDPTSDTALYLQVYVTLPPLDLDQTTGPRDYAHLLAATQDIAPLSLRLLQPWLWP